MHPEGPNKPNPLAQQRAYALQQTSSPRWAVVEMVLAMWDDSANCEGGLYLQEEDTTHPEQVPLLALRQVDDEGFVCGEVWFSPAQLPELIRALEEQLHFNFSGQRRWQGTPDGPFLNLGLPVRDGESDRPKGI